MTIKTKSLIQVKRSLILLLVTFSSCKKDQAKAEEETIENKQYLPEKNKAIALAKTILKKEVKIPSTAIKEIKAEMKTIITEKPLGLKN
ncbi:hypothetical protein JL193_04475 [Polaribacter batillariae]|uniref:Lipoprotein n=1 Tax=Polaribacter batillariae TaxID=2808900 RepID=A0ABX7T0E0_9FLAO|nr:hypothetical protein [Polaribacter batillariae]QTD38548.1 hypothetical protein JL193_04475 [Polaribacter batillariae]